MKQWSRGGWPARPPAWHGDGDGGHGRDGWHGNGYGDGDGGHGMDGDGNNNGDSGHDSGHDWQDDDYHWQDWHDDGDDHDGGHGDGDGEEDQTFVLNVM